MLLDLHWKLIANKLILHLYWLFLELLLDHGLLLGLLLDLTHS
jgi:hypothetical protein